jgi:UTP--glucose-1-phosphate uridylyltransferase
MKGVIVAAGYGTRFFPVTKTIPKEMLPLVNKPSIDFIIEEFIKSGITEILIITSRRKKTLEDYIDREFELESVLKAAGKTKELEQILPYDAEFFFVRQKEMKGTGHALLLAEPFIGNAPFVVAYPDDIHFGDVPLSRQLIDTYEKTGCAVLASIENPPNLSRYGVLALGRDGLHVEKIVEKPAKGQEPSRIASIGRYLFIPEIFEKLKEGLKHHGTGEFYHIGGINALAGIGKVVHKTVEGERLDTGEPLGYFEAILKYAASFPEYAEIINKYSN